MLKLLLLVLCVAALWWFVRNDASEYADFKRLTTTAERQRCYGRWVLKSFLTLTGVSVACLLILQRMHAVARTAAGVHPAGRAARRAHAHHPDCSIRAS